MLASGLAILLPVAPTVKWVWAPAAFRLVRVEMVGTYAVQPVWADGHATGIYSFDYLRRAAKAGEKPSD